MPKIIVWDKNEATRELRERLEAAKSARRDVEYYWNEAERTLFNTRGQLNTELANMDVTMDSASSVGIVGADQSDANYGINYAFKNYRFIHSQLSANPPTVIPRPTSSDPGDRRKADAADRLIRFAIRAYNMQETQDLSTANCLVYGTGFIKTVWNPEAGEPMETNPETGEMLMEGDIEITVPSPRNIYIDPDAATWSEVKYIFERIWMPWEEALFRFPNEKEELQKWRNKNDSDYPNTSDIQKAHRRDVVEIFQYWEKGLPHNGMIGRFYYCLPTGEVLGDGIPNPMNFPRPMDQGLDMPGPEQLDAPKRERPGKALLPYHILTDIDVPGKVWGMSFVFYEAPIQDLHNRIMNVSVDALQAHGVARMLVPEGTEIADDAITNSPWDIIKFTGAQPPHFMEPMPLPAVVNDLLGLAKIGIDDMAGVNESMFGQQQRETSGFSMQYATNQGNMIRRRLFNKYVLQVESVYKFFLSLVRKYWDEPRQVLVLGKEKAFEAIDLSGADIQGGFDITVEYGASLSLDPTTRREEIITLMPLFKEAGVEPRVIMQMLKLNELSGLYDEVQMAADRQREIFEEMIQSGTYIKPEELQDHLNMLSYASIYVMTSEFKYLDKKYKALISQHIKERQAMSPGAQAPAPVTPMGVPAAPPVPGPLQ